MGISVRTAETVKATTPYYGKLYSYIVNDDVVLLSHSCILTFV